VLSLKSNNLCAGGGKALAEGLKGNQVITELNLADNHMGLKSDAKSIADVDISGVIALAEAISGMGAMTSLHVGMNNILEKEMKAIITIAMSKESMKILCEVPIKDKTLLKLDISGKSLGYEGALVVAEYLRYNGIISSVDVTKNDIAFTHALFDLFAELSMKNQQVQISCKEGNTWGEEAGFYEAMFDEDILSSKKKERFDVQKRDIQGLIPWGFILRMIRHRGLRALLLGCNKFQTQELPHDLDLNGLEELDLSGNGSLEGKKILAIYYFICWAMCEFHGFV
jgi:hypothetical protein